MFSLNMYSIYLILIAFCGVNTYVAGQSKDYAEFTNGMSSRAGQVEIVKWDNLKQLNGMFRVPYYLDKSVGNQSEIVILRAIKAVYAQTCIQFDPAEIGDESIIRFTNFSSCSSFTGRKSGINTIYGCQTLGDILRAMVNALGIVSETLRPDRDNFVILFQERMRTDKLELTNIMTPEQAMDYLEFPYDINSITHFGPYQYAASDTPTVYSNASGKPVLQNTFALSRGDINRIQTWYNCSGTTGVQKTRDCYHIVDNGNQYRGNISITESGIRCQRWNGRSPQSHPMYPSILTGSGLERSYCRNPNMKDRPWCYTTTPSVRWEYCNITLCGTSNPLPTPTPLTSRRGFWGPWSAYSRCTRSCGTGYMYSVRPCIGSDVGSAECPGDYWKYLECNYGNCSGLLDQHQWKSWQEWSECVAACDNGTHTRVRSCDGIVGLDECIGESVQTENCTTGRSCPLYEGGECYNSSDPFGYRGTINIDRKGNACINWTNARITVSDFPNVDLQENFCRNPDEWRRLPYCFTARSKRSVCNVTQCNRRARWEQWGMWSACSTSCGVGTITKTRRCAVGHYGLGRCDGDVFTTGVCNITCRNGIPYTPDDEIRQPVTESPDPIPVNIGECLDFRDPQAYRGTKRRSKSGYECQEWDAVYPWRHNYSDLSVMTTAGLSENYCRAPDPGDKTPWCFVKEFFPMKEECNISLCPYSNSFNEYFASLWASFLGNIGVLP